MWAQLRAKREAPVSECTVELELLLAICRQPAARDVSVAPESALANAAQLFVRVRMRRAGVYRPLCYLGVPYEPCQLVG